MYFFYVRTKMHLTLYVYNFQVKNLPVSLSFILMFKIRGFLSQSVAQPPIKKITRSHCKRV